MAAPSSKSLTDLSGTWRLNKSLSDDYVSILTFQGVSSLISRALGAASVTLHITQPSRTTIHIAQSATAAAIPGVNEHYELDWAWRDQKDAFFGEMRGKSRWVKRGEVGGGDEGLAGEEVEFLKREGGDAEEEVVQAVSEKQDKRWSAVHVWGFEEVGGERRYARRVVVRNREGESKRVRMIYDFRGE